MKAHALITLNVTGKDTAVADVIEAIHTRLSPLEREFLVQVQVQIKVTKSKEETLQ